ncbi:class IV adenylate cyclase, partial [Candidatus Bipolaricaulota bacterium]|nr:class IV adenylate cyclase [Candidatus Bipolaricaulota bacterium]
MNIEIKAQIEDVALLRRRIDAISDMPCTELQQEDLFFTVPNCRLQLRTLSSEYRELFYCECDDKSDPKPSYYLITKTTDPAALKAVLTIALGFRGSVCKCRSLYRAGQAVAPPSSPCRTEAFTVSGGVVNELGLTPPSKTAEHAESGMRTLMLDLSALCAPGGCSKPLFGYYTPRC